MVNPSVTPTLLARLSRGINSCESTRLKGEIQLQGKYSGA